MSAGGPQLDQGGARDRAKDDGGTSNEDWSQGSGYAPGKEEQQEEDKERERDAERSL